MTLQEQIAEAVEELAAIPFFPSEPGARFAVMRAMEKFVSGASELRWLIDTAVGAMREWRGVAEVRGLYCVRFRPADGKGEACMIPGFTAGDIEASRALLPAAPERPRSNKLLKAGAVAELLEGEWQEIGVLEINPPSRTDRADEELRAEDAARRLASILGTPPPPPIRIPGTRKRTPEENAALERELQEQLNARRRVG
jgi:hypothetical protein